MMSFSHETKYRLSILFFLTLTSIMTVVGATYASTGTEVFRGFTSHISKQIMQDKQAFYVAQSCTTWFYKKIKKPKEAPVQKISFVLSSDPSVDFDCANRYPQGLDEAREAFSETQQSLSISLTFFEFALVGDRNDDQEYTDQELQDLIESFGERFEQHLPSTHYVTSLNRVFDGVIDKKEIQILTDSMSILLGKGYRFTRADQAALDRELN